MAQDSHFLKLPAELRLHIYEHLYEPPEGQYPVEASFPIWGPSPIWLHKLELRQENLHAACDSTKRTFWPLLQVCKLVNHELLDLLFERVLFTIFIAGNHVDGSSPPTPPKLGLAKDFQFWHRARRVLLVSSGEDGSSIKDLIRNLGKGFRYFKSTPQDTTAFLYLRDQFEFEVYGSNGYFRAKNWNRALKSFSSLSRRAMFDLEVRLRQHADDGEKVEQLADAANGSATLVCVEHRHPGIPRAGNEELILSSERFQRGHEADSGLIADQGNKKRIVCLMSSKARSVAIRQVALKRRKERLLVKKQLYEGRLG